jgi:hypothetical protein
MKAPDVSSVLHKPFTTVDEYVSFWSAMDSDAEATKFFAMLAQRLLSHEKERGKHSHDSSGALQPASVWVCGPSARIACCAAPAAQPPLSTPHRARQLRLPERARAA